jgi:hypothetical protein
MLIAPRLDVEVSSLVLRQISLACFLLVLPREELVPSLTERGHLLRAATFSIACKRWSRFMGSTDDVLSSLVELELSGIPIHAWETSTASQLLSPFAWIRCVHPDMFGLANLAVFRCTA